MPDRVLTVNNVGGHPDSPNDLWRRQVVFRDFADRGLQWDRVKHNWIDLPEHDFLLEQPIADVTILHFITDCESSHPNHVGLFNISYYHSIERWRWAVFNTFSKYIYVFGDWDEISGAKLGELPGYVRELFPNCRDRFNTDLYIYINAGGR